MNYLEEYYNNYDEEGRLLSRHGQVEYLTTMRYTILKYKSTTFDRGEKCFIPN